MHDAVALWCEHSETDLTIKITKRPKHPIKRLVWFWQQIQADVLLNNVVKPANLTDLQEAIKFITDNVNILRHNRVGRRLNEENQFICSANEHWHMYQMMPALRTLFQAAEKELTVPLEGFAVCKNAEIIELKVGLAFYHNHSIAKEVMDGFIKEWHETDLSIRPVRLSAIKGIEYLDDNK